MAESKSNPFGFDGLNDGGLDLSDFAPKPKAVDREKAAATRDVARDSGFTRRTAPSRVERPAPRPVETSAAVPRPAPAPKAERSRKRRVNITELMGVEDRYPDAARAQINMLAPTPVVMRWRTMLRDHNEPAWSLLEQAMDALEGKAPRRKG